MSKTHLHAFGPGGRNQVALPFDLESLLADWASLRVSMTRHLAPGFERDEWAYLIQFLATENLAGAYRGSFGEPYAGLRESGAGIFLRPRGQVAVWLPNNVSLLGPLTLVLLSITGNRLWFKGGSRSADLTGEFLAYVFEHLRPGPLRFHLERSLEHASFDRADKRNAGFAAGADVRILFGSDAAAQAIDALAHPLESSSFAFIDRRSEAWVEPACVDAELVDTLVKVFGIYGQAGCTSPRRVVLLGGTPGQAHGLRDALLARWNGNLRRSTAPHQASMNQMARQWAAALGWDAVLGHANSAAFLVGGPELESIESPLALAVVPMPLSQALEQLPENIQTIGHAVGDTRQPCWLEALASSRIKRLVPLGRMHHFGPLWDGANFWRQTFQEVELDL